ncbi:MAG: Ig-like domain-containing protein [Hyalangium sp.]|uniref:Ig-like domain-containing protein n=1 Tax=Hyalangium sp. TaxID=2028555 RepID=UPI00389ADB2A
MHGFAVARRTSRSWLGAALLLSLGGWGCGGGDDTTSPTNVRVTGGVTAGETLSGRRTLEATAQDDSGKLSKVEFYVSGALACTDAEAKNSGATFSCSWDFSTNAPGSQQLTAKAYDAAGNSSLSAPVDFTVSTPNRAPTLSQVLASPSAIHEASSTTLTVTASDADGDPLTYAWTQAPVVPAGTWGSESGVIRTWTAPFVSHDTVFTLKVTVSDGKGGTAQLSVDVPVANVAALNRAPTVDATISAPAQVIAGDTVNLSIGATDQDGDPLTYAWKTNPSGEGTFMDAADGLSQWRSPDIATATPYSFQVTVSDGTSSVTRSVDVRVNVPTYARDIQPLWTPTCTGCHNDSPNTFGSLSLEADSSYAALVNKNGVGVCSSLKRVLPGQPEDSLLIQKSSGESCGGRMPQTDPEYFDKNPGELTRIRSWILAGALNN